jgi:hypothetical protein
VGKKYRFTLRPPPVTHDPPPYADYRDFAATARMHIHPKVRSLHKLRECMCDIVPAATQLCDMFL